MILASFFSWAYWFESYLVENPEDRFSHDVAHMVKTFWNLLNRLADVTETWYTASVTRVLPSLLKWWAYVDLFTQRSTLVPYAFVWENAKMMDHLETIEVYGIKIGIYSKPNEYMEIYMYQRSRSFFNLCPSHSDFINFKQLFSLNRLDRLLSNCRLNLHESRGPKCMEAVEAKWPR